MGPFEGAGQVRAEPGERRARPLFTGEAAHSPRSTGGTGTTTCPDSRLSNTSMKGDEALVLHCGHRMRRRKMEEKVGRFEAKWRRQSTTTRATNPPAPHQYAVAVAKVIKPLDGGLTAETSIVQWRTG
ncbi:uncharacterized protein LOC144006686 [Festucalex cinctus]